MNIVKQEVNKTFPFTGDFYSNIDICAEVARLSRGKEKSDRESNIRTVNYLIKNRHDEPLEFCPIYIDLIKFGQRYSARIVESKSKKFANVINKLVNQANEQPTSHTRVFNNHSVLVTTLREIVEGLDESTLNDPTRDTSLNVTTIYDEIKTISLDDNSLKSLVYAGIVKPRIAVIVTTNRQIATELSRHRCLSKNWESTRFVIYNNGLTFCLVDNDIQNITNGYYNLLSKLEKIYQEFKEAPELKHLQAFLLPSALKVSCGFAAFTDDWENVSLKRTTKFCGNPHKYIIELVSEIMTNVKKAITYDDTEEVAAKKKLEDDINNFVKNILPDDLKTSDYNEVLNTIYKTIKDYVDAPRIDTKDHDENIVEKTDCEITKSCHNCRYANNCQPHTQLDCLFNRFQNWEPIDEEKKETSDKDDTKKADIEKTVKAITDLYSDFLKEIGDMCDGPMY